MDKKTLKIILQKERLFVPLIFTEKQFNVLKKYNNHLLLSNAEKKALYTSINKKVKALESIKIEKDKEYYINGYNKIIPGRLDKAKELITKYSKEYDKVFISGSFLFSKEFNDIDIFIVRKKGYKEIWEGDRHIVSLSEKRLTKTVFQSAALISVSNFIIPKKIKRKTLKLGELMSSYHEAGIEIMDKQERELTRHIVFSYYLYVHDKLLDGAELAHITKSTTLNKLDSMVKSILTNLFSNTYLYVVLHTYIKTLDGFIQSEKNIEHLKRYKSLYEGIIYDSKRSTTASA